jgi:hypothetical protein
MCPCCDSEARAEVAELADRGQSLPGDAGERLVGRNEEVGVGAAIASSDSTAELVEL